MLFRNLRKRLLVVVVLLVLVMSSVAIGSVLTSENPTSRWVAVQARQEKLVAWPDETDLGVRTPLIYVHGISHDTPAGSVVSDEISVATFEMLDTNMRNSIFPQEHGIVFDKCFKTYRFQYDEDLSPEENGAVFADIIVSAFEWANEDIEVIIIGHSVGGVVALYAEPNPEALVAGVVGLGVPVNGTPLADPVVLRDICVREVGSRDGNVLADNIIAAFDFESGVMQWLHPNSWERKRFLQTIWFDDNCYFIAGSIEPVRWDTVEGTWRAVGFLDSMFIAGNSHGAGAQAYGFGAAVIESAGYGSSDGMVPVSSAMADGHRDNAHALFAGEYDHSQIVRGAGDMDCHRLVAQAILDIYNDIPKREMIDFGEIEDALPDMDWVADLSGFGITLDSPVDWWSQNGSDLIVHLENGSSRTLPLVVEEGVEIDIDESGWRLAVPSSNGLVVYDLDEGSSRLLIDEPVDAVGWCDGTQEGYLIVARDKAIQVVDTRSLYFGTLLRDERLRVTSRIAVQNGKFYLANHAWGSYALDLYSADVTKRYHDLDDVHRFRENVTFPPRKMSRSIAGIHQDGKFSKLEWLANQKLTQDVEIRWLLGNNLMTNLLFDQVSDMTITDQGEILVCADGEIMSLQLDAAREYYNEYREEVKRLRRNKLPMPEKIVTEIDMGKVLPVVGYGSVVGSS